MAETGRSSIEPTLCSTNTRYIGKGQVNTYEDHALRGTRQIDKGYVNENKHHTFIGAIYFCPGNCLISIERKWHKVRQFYESGIENKSNIVCFMIAMKYICISNNLEPSKNDVSSRSSQFQRKQSWRIEKALSCLAQIYPPAQVENLK